MGENAPVKDKSSFIAAIQNNGQSALPDTENCKIRVQMIQWSDE